jgi:PAS domain S-box-containing protein
MLAVVERWPSSALDPGRNGRLVMTSLAFDGSPNDTPVGYFTYTVDDDHWAWSEGLYALHGYAPHEIEATTELMLEHKHPEDTARTLDVLETVIRDGAPFSCYHRIIDARGRVRSVLAVGRGLLGARGKVEQVTGFFVDLTEVRRSETQRGVDAALVEIAKTRSVIDQAKGIVMVGTGCDADEAFALLRRSSSYQNVKLNELARRLVERASWTRPRDEDNNGRLRSVLRLLSHSETTVRDPLSRLFETVDRQ